MALSKEPTWPVEMRCPACGREWTQWKPEVMEHGEPLRCACGAIAETNEREEDTSLPPVLGDHMDPGCRYGR